MLNNLKHLHRFLILSIPLFLITGPFLPDFSVSISGLLLIYFLVKEKKYDLINNKYFYFFFSFYLYLLISSLLSDNLIHSLGSSLFYFRFIFLSLSIYYILSHDKKFIDYIYILLTIIIFFLILDSFVQYFFGKNTIGLEPRAGDRITSFFGQKSILGSFMIRFLPIYIGCFFLSKIKLKYFFIFNIILAPLVIVLSGERTALLLFIMLVILCLIFLNIKKTTKIFITTVPTLLVTILLLLSPKTIERIYTKTFTEISNFMIYDSDNIKKYQLESSNANSNNVTSIRHSLYLNSFLIFKDNILFGAGPKNFRIECKKNEKKINIITHNDTIEEHKVGCSTHPHSTYIQLLAEVGIIGFLFILGFYIFIISKVINLYLNYYTGIKNYNASMLFLFAFLLNFFPFIPSGNFFNNWLSIIYFYPLGFLLIKND